MAEKKVIVTEAAPKAIGPYSQGTSVGNLVFTAGQLGLEPKSGNMAGNDIKTQTKQVMENIKAILAAAGGSLSDVTKTTVFLKNMDHFGEMNQVYGEYFPKNPPARSTVQVAGLPKDGLVEIETIAYIP